MATINGIKLTDAQEHFIRSVLQDMRRRSDAMQGEWNVHKHAVLEHVCAIEDILDQEPVRYAVRQDQATAANTRKDEVVVHG